MTGPLFCHESLQRQRSMLRTAMGHTIFDALNDATVSEIMVNPDGVVRIERHGGGIAETGLKLLPAEVERIIRLVAAAGEAPLLAGGRIVSTELPERNDGGAGERFEALLPPLVPAPCFSIRKPASRTLTLADYLRQQMLTLCQMLYLIQAIRTRRNIVIAGGTASGKTTFANALLGEIARQGERLIVIEDTLELKPANADTVRLRSRPGLADLRDLVRSSLRLRPDRIVIGEVRGGEALDLLKAWNTGHPGGLATLHANSAQGALERLEQLCLEVLAEPPRRLIGQAVDVVVHLIGRGAERRVAEIIECTGTDADERYQITPAFRSMPAEGSRALHKGGERGRRARTGFE
jgi:type IV secretion system protein TrbB